MVCSLPSLHHHSLPRHLPPLVGAAPSLSICVSARNSLSRIWLLRFFIYLPHHWKPHGSRPILCFPRKGHEGNIRSHCYLPHYRRDHHISGASNPFRGGLGWNRISCLGCHYRAVAYLDRPRSRLG